MPAGFIGPLSHVFRYVTLRQLRSESIIAEDVDDCRAYNLIALCSNWINWLTQQWFLPMRVSAKVDGRNSPLAHLPTFVPILDLYELSISKENLFNIVLPDIAYNVKPRYVRMLSDQARLPIQPIFVTLDGVFGWLEDDFTKTTTELTADVTEGAHTLSVVSSAGIRAGDAIMVGDDPTRTWSCVVDTVPNATTIVVDPVNIGTLRSGDIVRRYGRVPSLIRWATILLIKDKKTPIGLQGTEDDENSPRWFAERLQNESVEGYSYGLAGLPRAYGPGGGAWTTGNPEVDDILSQFVCTELYVGGIA